MGSAFAQEFTTPGTAPAGPVPSIAESDERPADVGAAPQGFLPERAGELSEGPLDPDLYRVGPGDRFQLIVWGAANFTLQLVIGPEGSVFVPNVGVLDLRDRTLAQTRTLVQEAVLDVYSNVEVEMLLTARRRFKVYVIGAVRWPGSYSATATTRVSDIIGRAGGPLDHASRRRIHLRFTGGEEVPVDLAAYELVGSLRMNPFVSDGAVINVPYRASSVLISGTVFNPGTFEPLPGERLSELLAAVGGLRPGVDSTRVTLSRFVTPTTTSETTFHYGPNTGDAFDPALKDGDRFFFRSVPDWHRNAEVFVYGEVMRPGRYAIGIDGTPVGEVLERAGGVTSRAALSQATIRRPPARLIPPPESVSPTMFGVDRGSYEYAAAQAALDTVLVACDFEAVAKGDSTGVLLQDGDIVQIPRDRGEVRVVGLVRRPGSYPHAPDRPVSYYVDLAGGYDKEADKGRTRLSRFEGGPLRAPDGAEVRTGAVIYVPPKERKSLFQQTREAVGFIVQLASIVVIVDSLQR